jgi:multidrug efflux pump subunit AcrA (membrane-fusion protein)
MKISDCRGRFWLGVGVACLAAWGTSAGAAEAVKEVTGASPAQLAAPALPASAPGQAVASGTIQELRDRIQNKEVTELRTTYNGRYGASLLFHPQTMGYYVALFHEGQFWRVVKLNNEKKAETLYGDFVRQTQVLADVEIRRIKLEAQKAFMERQLAESEARLNAVQNDLAIQRQQEQALAENQQAVREQASALETERTAARIRLTDLQGQIRSLEAEQNSADSDLVRSIKNAAGRKPIRRR